jgi:hypothetical protein
LRFETLKLSFDLQIVKKSYLIVITQARYLGSSSDQLKKSWKFLDQSIWFFCPGSLFFSCFLTRNLSNRVYLLLASPVFSMLAISIDLINSDFTNLFELAYFANQYPYHFEFFHFQFANRNLILPRNYFYLRSLLGSDMTELWNDSDLSERKLVLG